MGKSILFFSYYFDPGHVTATRNFYVVRSLALKGFNVHVITRPLSEEIKQSLSSLSIHFYEVDALDYRRFLSIVGFNGGVTSDKIKPGKLLNWAHNQLLKYPWNIILGEGGGFYYAKAMDQAKKIIKNNNIDFVYSSYRPLSDHFLAQGLKIKFPTLKWIGDFRDVLWYEREDSNYKKSWIKSMIKNMDYVTAVTAGIADFWSSVFKKEVIPFYNGLPDYPLVPASEIRLPENKFVINYTGKIFTPFQKADIFFLSLCELIKEEKMLTSDVLLVYSGIHHHYWRYWIHQHKLENISLIHRQVSLKKSWALQQRAQLNLLLTWCNSQVSGFIHGKFNEYVAAGKPILCLIHGNTDKELERIYYPITNSRLFYNELKEKEKIKEFILTIYGQWKQKIPCAELPASVRDNFNWSKTIEPLMSLLNK